MKTVSDILRDSDPLRDDPYPLGRRDLLRKSILAAASDVRASSSSAFRRPLIATAAMMLILAGIVAIGSRVLPAGTGTVQAAVRFEVRLAEAQPTLGLRPARLAGSDRVVYLHEEIIVTNEDILQSRVIQGSEPSRFGVAVEFNARGAERMQRATAGHIGGPVAILIDGQVISVPVLRARISTSAVISGDFTKAEAERIANGMTLR